MLHSAENENNVMPAPPDGVPDFPKSFLGFYNWWTELARVGQLAPSVTLFYSSLPDVLVPCSFLLERDRSGDILVTEAGEVLEAISSEPLKGSRYLTRFSERQVQHIMQRMVHICGQPCGADFTRSIYQRNGMHVRARHLMLPLTNRQGLVSYIAGLVEVLELTEPVHGMRKQASDRFEAGSFLDIGCGLPG